MPRITKTRLQRYSKMLGVENPEPGDLLRAVNENKHKKLKANIEPKKTAKIPKKDFNKLAALI